MGYGGFRPGSGRKRLESTIRAEAYRQVLFKEVEKEKTAVAAALVREAKKGNINAIKEIHDRLMGRSAMNLELTGKDGKDLPAPILNYLVQNPQITLGNVQQDLRDEQDYIDVEAHTSGERGNLSIQDDLNPPLPHQ